MEKTLASLSAAYNKASEEYTKALLERIKELLASINPSDPAHTVDIKDLLEENRVKWVGKCWTPGESAENYILFSFGTEAGSNKPFASKGDLNVTGYGVADPDDEWTFDEENFSIAELEAIQETLSEVKNALDEGDFAIDGSSVREALYEHIGYYNDTEDLLLLARMDDAAVVKMMLDGEGAFHTTPGETLNLDEVESTCDRKAARTGDYLVVNGAKDVDDPEEAFAEPDPDCGVFVDIYKLVTIKKS